MMRSSSSPRFFSCIELYMKRAGRSSNNEALSPANFQSIAAAPAKKVDLQT